MPEQRNTIAWLRRFVPNGSATHAFRLNGVNSLCGLLTRAGDWRPSPDTVRCYLCERKARADAAKETDTTPPRLFDGRTGRTPLTEARRHVYKALVGMLTLELENPNGLIFNQVGNEDDKRRLAYAIKQIRAELDRK